MTRYIASLLCVLMCTIAHAQNPDIDALQAIHTHRSVALDPAFKFTTASASVVSMAVPTTVVAVGFLQDDKAVMRKGLYIGGSMAANVIFTYALKYSIQRDRPYDVYPNMVTPYQIESSYSLPSGHTSNAFATATALSIAFPKWYVAGPAFAWAGAVGYSRMHLGVHYPSDVLAGALVGAGSAWLCHYINQRIFQKPEQE